MSNFGDLVTRPKGTAKKNYKKGDNSLSTINPTFPKSETGGVKPLMNAEEWRAFCEQRRKSNQ